MNTQQMFDRVATHLLTQNEMAMKDGGCAYRGEEGTMCAVGCLIDDKVYSKELEGHSLWDENLDDEENQVTTAVENSIGRPITTKEFNMLQELQQLHDGARVLSGEPAVKGWPTGLRSIAKRYELSDEVVDNA